MLEIRRPVLPLLTPPHQLGDLGPATCLREPPFNPCNGWMQCLLLQFDCNETELVTVSCASQVCHVSGGIMLFLAITYSPGSPENVGLLGFGGLWVRTDS